MADEFLLGPPLRGCSLARFLWSTRLSWVVAETVGEGPRVKFRAEYRGSREDWACAADLVRVMRALEVHGCCPVLDDGLAAGNAAIRRGHTMLTTPSGRVPGAVDARDLVEVESVDLMQWSVGYRARTAAQRPSSDTPLHWAILMDPGAAPHAHQGPLVSLHGHVLHTEAAAEALSIPSSDAETLFSTPEDRAAMVALLRAHPYPRERAWIRAGHGFVVAGADLEETLAFTLDLANRARRLGFLPPLP